jgi:hypothetical protein
MGSGTSIASAFRGKRASSSRYDYDIEEAGSYYSPATHENGQTGTAALTFTSFDVTTGFTTPTSALEGVTVREEYQTITFHPGCRNLSLEELRVADYNNGLGPVQRQGATQAVQTQDQQMRARSRTFADRPRIQL